MSGTSRSTRTRFVAAFRREIAHTAARTPGRTVDEHLLRRRHAVADAAADGRRDPRRDRAGLGGRAERRGDARGQPDERRGRALPGLPRGRRQPGLARRPGPERCRPAPARTDAFRRRGAGRREGRRLDLRALLLRPHLRPARTRRRRPGARSWARRSAMRPSISRSTSSPSSPAPGSSGCTGPASSRFRATTRRASSTR